MVRKRSVTRRFLAFLLLAVTGSLLACDDTQDPVVPQPFQLRIVVEDSEGNPVPGLRLSAFSEVPEHLLPDVPGTPCAVVPARTKPLGATTLHFCLPESASVQILVRDVETNPVVPLVDQVLSPGAFVVAWDTRNAAGLPVPGGIYEFLFHAVARTGEFEASTWALYHRGADDVLGFTDALGRFETTDRKRFPGLYGVDSLQARDAEGNDRGKFVLTDRITLVAVDTLAGLSQCYTTSISDAPQSLRMTWDPAAAPAFFGAAGAAGSLPIGPAEIPIPVPGDWESCSPEVFPNPFN